MTGAREHGIQVAGTAAVMGLAKKQGLITSVNPALCACTCRIFESVRKPFGR